MRITRSPASPVYVSFENTSGGNQDISLLALADLGHLSVEVYDLFGIRHNAMELKSVSAGTQYGIAADETNSNHTMVRASVDRGEQRFARRVIQLEGANNFRDFGGYQSSDSAQMPWRRFFRSENLAKLTAEDFKEMERLGIKRIFDLRRPDEIAISPTSLPTQSQFELINIAVSGQISGFDDAVIGAFKGHIAEITIADMVAMYNYIIDKYSDTLLFVAQQILDGAAGASLVHCTAGKDRTGMVVALIQLAYGVSRQDVFYDYLLSNRLRTPWRIATLAPEFRRRDLDISKFKSYFSAPFQALDESFDRLSVLAEQLSVE